MEYFRVRHEQGEAMTLTSTHDNDKGNFEYTLQRQARDVPLTGYVGKGLLVCESGTQLALWLMDPT